MVTTNTRNSLAPSEVLGIFRGCSFWGCTQSVFPPYLPGAASASGSPVSAKYTGWSASRGLIPLSFIASCQKKRRHPEGRRGNGMLIMSDSPSRVPRSSERQRRRCAASGYCYRNYSLGFPSVGSSRLLRVSGSG